LITTTGGPHVTYGYGNECPDALVTDFLVNDVVPTERETVCEGYVADDFVPVAPRKAQSFADPLEALSAMETEIYYLPEFFYWDGYTPTAAGCNYGGTFDFSINDAGTRYNFKLNRCEFTNNFKMTGRGFYNPDNDRFVLAVKTTGRWSCNLIYTRHGETINITGKCDGKRINGDFADNERQHHNIPAFSQTKQD
jgi:hypothetical protein